MERSPEFPSRSISPVWVTVARRKSNSGRESLIEFWAWDTAVRRRPVLREEKTDVLVMNNEYLPFRGKQGNQHHIFRACRHVTREDKGSHFFELERIEPEVTFKGAVGMVAGCELYAESLGSIENQDRIAWAFPCPAPFAHASYFPRATGRASIRTVSSICGEAIFVAPMQIRVGHTVARNASRGENADSGHNS